MKCLAFVQRQRSGLRGTADWGEAVQIVRHMRFPAERDAMRRKPCLHVRGTNEHVLRHTQIHLTAQFEERLTRATGRVEKITVVHHDPIGIVQLRNRVQIEGTAKCNGRSGLAGNDQAELLPAMDIEQFLTILERKAAFHGSVIEKSSSQLHRAFVGMQR